MTLLLPCRMLSVLDALGIRCHSDGLILSLACQLPTPGPEQSQSRWYRRVAPRHARVLSGPIPPPERAS